MKEATVPKSKTRVRAASGGDVTMTQEEYESFLTMKAELATMLQQKNNSFWRCHIVPIAKMLWQSRIAWLLTGILIPAVANLCFQQGESIWWKNPINITIQTDFPNQIAKLAPNNTEADKVKRKRLIQVYQKTAENIRSNTTTSISNAMTEIRTGLISLQSGQWEHVSDALDVYLSKANDLESLADKLDEVVKAFLQL